MKNFLLLSLTVAVSIITAKATEPSGSLPVIYITTENNAEITDTENYISATFYIDAMSSGYASTGTETSQVALKIRGRGNTSWLNYDKKPYRIKLTVGQKLLGMSKSKNFALMAYADDGHAFLRSTTGYKISQLMNLAYTPDRRPVELILNGDYKGLYFLTETIRIDKDRVPITKQDDEATDASIIPGGWLLEIDNAESAEQVSITEGNGMTMRFTYKDPEALSTEQTDYLMSQLNEMNNAIYNTDKTSATWEQYIDIDTLARFYIVQEVMDNTEAFHGSTYLYKDRCASSNWNFGPVWDFANSLRRTGQKFIYQDSPDTPQHWIAEIAKFPAFQSKVRELWADFYEKQYPSISPYLDSFISAISSAATNDVQRWPSYGTSDTATRTAEFKALLDARVAWLNEQWTGSGTESIMTPDSHIQPIYYNLQGIMVENPAKGNVYIKVQGNKAVKEYVK